MWKSKFRGSGRRGRCSAPRGRWHWRRPRGPTALPVHPALCLAHVHCLDNRAADTEKKGIYGRKKNSVKTVNCPYHSTTVGAWHPRNRQSLSQSSKQITLSEKFFGIVLIKFHPFHPPVSYEKHSLPLSPQGHLLLDRGKLRYVCHAG